MHIITPLFSVAPLIVIRAVQTAYLPCVSEIQISSVTVYSRSATVGELGIRSVLYTKPTLSSKSVD